MNMKTIQYTDIHDIVKGLDWHLHDDVIEDVLDEAFCTSVGDMDFSIVNVDDVRRWLWHSITFHQLHKENEHGWWISEEDYQSRFNNITKDVTWVNVQHMRGVR